MARSGDDDRILEKGRDGEYVGLRIHPRQPIRLERIGDHDAGLLVSVRRAAPVAARAWFEESPPNPERNSHHERLLTTRPDRRHLLAL